MLERKETLAQILKGCSESFEAQGFAVSIPENTPNGSVPVFNDENGEYIEFTKEDVTVRLVSHDNLLDVMEKIDDGDFKRTESNLLDLDSFEERDIKSLCNEINDTIKTSYGKKARQSAKKAPVPISKSAVRGGMTYDANTLANRLTGLYPELKEPYKWNFEKYGEFLGEDFFVNYGNKYIMGTIRGSDKQQMKKLFKILSEIYENGSSDTQDLIAVTILGELNNDKELLAKCREEIEDDDFYDTVAAVNAFLASSAGKKAKKQLENPPKYRPKRKKGGLMSALGGGMPQQ